MSTEKTAVNEDTEVKPAWGALKGSPVVALTPNETHAFIQVARVSYAATMDLENLLKSLGPPIGDDPIGYYVTKFEHVGEVVARLELMMSSLPKAPRTTVYVHMLRDAYHGAVSQRLRLAGVQRHPLGVGAWLNALTAMLTKDVPLWWSKGHVPTDRILSVELDASGRVVVESWGTTPTETLEWHELGVYSLVATTARRDMLLEDARKGRMSRSSLKTFFDFLPTADNPGGKPNETKVFVVGEYSRARTLLDVADMAGADGVHNANDRKVLRWAEALVYGGVIGGAKAWGYHPCS